MGLQSVRRIPAQALLTLCVIAGLTTIGCEKKPAVPTATGGTAVSPEDARQATFPSENTASGSIQLKGGQYDDADRVASELDDIEAVGDMDGDGNEDRVVVMVTSTGGSGIFRELYVLRRVAGQLQVSQPAALGDRVIVNDVKVANGVSVVDLTVQGNDDPLCCPTQHVVYQFRLDGNELVETTGQRRVYLKM